MEIEIETRVAHRSRVERMAVPGAAPFGWRPGQELVSVDAREGVLLEAAQPFAETELEQVAGSLEFDGPPKMLEEMG
jgi:hypothetical protein